MLHAISVRDLEIWRPWSLLVHVCQASAAQEIGLTDGTAKDQTRFIGDVGGCRGWRRKQVAVRLKFQGSEYVASWKSEGRRFIQEPQTGGRDESDAGRGGQN